MEKIGRNSKCPCGSGKKYKQCCLPKCRNTKNREKKFIDRISELPFSVSIRSKNGADSEIKISSVEIMKNGIVNKILEDEISIATGSVVGESTNENSAILSIPQNRNELPIIEICGNATVKNNRNNPSIRISGTKNELKIDSLNNLFALIRIVFRRDVQKYCFDILFGEKNREETIDANGIKQRPHLVIYPDGNSKYFRFVGYKCDINQKMTYDHDTKLIVPIEIVVTFEDYTEKMILSFQYLREQNIVELLAGKYS
jgi:hypothetical protein